MGNTIGCNINHRDRHEYSILKWSFITEISLAKQFGFGERSLTE